MFFFLYPLNIGEERFLTTNILLSLLLDHFGEPNVILVSVTTIIVVFSHFSQLNFSLLPIDLYVAHVLYKIL